MSLEKILDRIEDETLKEITRIQETYNKKIHLLLSEAHEEGDRTYGRIIHEAERIIRINEAREISQAKIQARTSVRQAREFLIEKCFSEARVNLSEFRNNPVYPDILLRMVFEGAEILGSSDIVIQADPVDIPLLITLFEHNRNDIQVTLSDRPIRTIGGVIVIDAGSSTTVDNTFEARLERMHKELVIKVARILLPGEYND